MLQASHWIGRGKQKIRHDLRNINAQCSRCHTYFHHGYHGKYDAYMEEAYSRETIAELRAAEEVNMWKWSIPELVEIRNNLRTLYLAHRENYERECGEWPENDADLKRIRSAQGETNV